MTHWLDVVADIETYYCSASKYSLRSKGMDIPAYLLDPRYELIGSAFKIDKGTTYWVDGLDVPKHLRELENYSRQSGRPIRMANHNTLFDACALNWHYGFLADCYVDTLAMSRAILGAYLRRHDLATVARYLGLGEKGSTIHKVNGMRRADIIAAGFYQEYAAYSCLDADLCQGIFDKLFPLMPVSELAITDTVMRMAIEPILQLDQSVLYEHLGAVQAEKQTLLANVGFDVSTPQGAQLSKDILMSNDKFAQVLEALGVDPPEKVSPSDPTKLTWAFAKSDDGMKELLEHRDPTVQALTAARLGIKSTLEETRTERFIRLSGLTMPALGTNLFPVALKVSGAHTHRLSGDWKLNQQNLSRPSRRRPRAMLRESIVAPAGHTIVAGDESQIEARANAVFCGQWDLADEFARGGDPYCTRAASVFGMPVTPANVQERFIGKQLVLMCGYGVGWRKYQASIKHVSYEQMGTAMLLSDQDAQRHVGTYRSDMFQISGMWKYLQEVIIPAMTNPSTDFMLGPVRVMYQKIVLPNGLCLFYDKLHRDPQTREWIFFYGGRIKRLYGGKLLENIIQALCRVIIMDAALRLRRPMAKLRARLAMQVHDELVYVVPDEHAHTARALLTQELTRRPDYMPLLPLACTTGMGKSYGKAK